ncbi:putative orphan protein [Pseudoalteromonas translucida]|uniref:Orphan protein n=1 Tax=Pseudoalteromonas translucida (strain TAC 125) TaxID=326442 RepID=Q3IFU5_PSET1|nr:putative orphan protein [Pseudoalteromonas translucida]
MHPAHAPNKELIAPKNPSGSACLVLILRYRLFMGNNHTT